MTVQKSFRKRALTSIDVVIVFIVSVVLLSIFKYTAEDERISGIYFHEWPSDSMMETLPSALLKKSPMESLFYLHIEPPLLDGIRALIVRTWDKKNDLTLGEYLDLKFYWVLGGFFGLLASMIYLWVKIATKSRFFSALVTMGWICYPTPIFFSTFLDSTLIGTVFITWMVFELWLFRLGTGSIARLLVASVLCFLTRTFFQWYFFPILLASLLLLGVGKKVFWQAAIVLAVVVGGYSYKQYHLFGTLGTTTFAAEHLTGMLWIESANPSGGLVWLGTETVEHMALIKSYTDDNIRSYPAKASDVEGGYNTKKQWNLNYAHSRIAKEYCGKDPYKCLYGVWRSLKTNWSEYWKIESWGKSILTESYSPWVKTQYFRISTRYLPLLVFAAFWFVLLAKRGKNTWLELYKILGLILVPGYLFGVCILGNRFDWYEGGRMRFFLEPVLYVFITVQLYEIFRSISEKRSRKCRLFKYS